MFIQTQQDSDSEQVAFEAWAQNADPAYNCEKYSTGKYRMNDTRYALEVWRAAIASAKARGLLST